MAEPGEISVTVEWKGEIRKEKGVPGKSTISVTAGQTPVMPARYARSREEKVDFCFN